MVFSWDVLCSYSLLEQQHSFACKGHNLFLEEKETVSDTATLNVVTGVRKHFKYPKSKDSLILFLLTRHNCRFLR